MMSPRRGWPCFWVRTFYKDAAPLALRWRRSQTTASTENEIMKTKNIALALALLALPAVVQAQFDYTTHNGTVTITGYTGPCGDVAIPDTIDGYLVTSIGDFAFDYAYFSSCASLTSVTIPNSVT